MGLHDISGYLSGLSRHLGMHDEPIWICGAVITVLVVALVHWGGELRAAFAQPLCGEKVAKNGVNGVNGLNGVNGKILTAASKSTSGVSQKNRLKNNFPAATATNSMPSVEDLSQLPHREHSLASGFLDQPEPEDAKRATCGLVPHWQSKAVTVEAFGRSLQRMIIACREQRENTRIRIFDDCSVQDSLDGEPLTLTECRCTQFRRLRTAAHLTEEQYCQSMCSRPFTGGKVEAAGKSGSFFMRTFDNKFVLKTIEEHEFVCLKDILPHMVLYLESHEQSLLCRFLGAYTLQIGQKTLSFVVMCNVLPHKTDEVYDLKGTTEDRWVDPSTKGCLKDNNFQGQRMLFPAEPSHRLTEQIQDDAEFLMSLGVMDYSLLVGIAKASEHPMPDPQGHLGTLVASGLLERLGSRTAFVFQMGIIDYLQRWTPKKVAAHWLKKVTLGCVHEIDTEPPTVYHKRFYKYLFDKIQSADNTK